MTDAVFQSRRDGAEDTTRRITLPPIPVNANRSSTGGVGGTITDSRLWRNVSVSVALLATGELIAETFASCRKMLDRVLDLIQNTFTTLPQESANFSRTAAVAETKTTSTPNKSANSPAPTKMATTFASCLRSRGLALKGSLDITTTPPPRGAEALYTEGVRGTRTTLLP